MHQCLKKHTKLAGCSIVTMTTAVELLGLCLYLSYYDHYLSQGTASVTVRNSTLLNGQQLDAGSQNSEEDQEKQQPDDFEEDRWADGAAELGEQRKLDPGAVIGVSITFISVLGKWKKHSGNESSRVSLQTELASLLCSFNFFL